MRKTIGSRTLVVLISLILVLPATNLIAIEPPQGDGVAARQYGAPDFFILNAHQPLSKFPDDMANRLRPELATLGVPATAGFYDVRAGRWGTLMAAKPLVPGPGVGNGLTWLALGRTAPANDAEYHAAAWQAFRGWLDANIGVLGVESTQLGTPTVGSYESRRLVHLYADRVFNGVPVRSSFITATLNSGNLVLYGTQNWAPVAISTTPTVSSSQAQATVRMHLSGFTIASYGRPELVIVPLASGAATPANEGRGVRHRLAWAFGPKVAGSDGTWEALVDAHSGELLGFYDRNQYLDQKKVIGGIFPVSNDGLSSGAVPDGIEQPGFPMSRAYVFDSNGNRLEANSEGLVNVNGFFSTSLTGPFLKIVENCGNINESTTCPSLDLGMSPGTDCTVPAGRSAGDTHSARTGFYEVNRLIDQAKTWLGPASASNLWVNRQLPANMNINNSCNAFFSPADTGNPATGSINFYRQVSASPNSGRCRNTGEIAAVFDHEWGHGLDFFDDSPGVSQPGEAYADMAAIVRLNTSCIGRGFFTSGNCGGNGDPCTDCSGVREADWKKRQSQRPHDLTWVLGESTTVPGSCGAQVVPPTPFNSGPCGRSTHCEGSIVTEAFWDLVKRDLPCNTRRWETFAGGPVAGGRCSAGQPATIDEKSAAVLGTRLFYLAAGGVKMGYQCDVAVGGCVASSWYLQILAADDDNGSTLDGTPHMVAINDAFIRHGIGCGVPLAMNSGCTATPAPTASPTVTATAGVQSATITWTAVPGAAEYWVMRTDGVHGCNFGKTRIAEVAANAPLTLTQSGLLDGLTYYYSVVPVGGLLGVPADSCTGPMSDCASVTPLAPTSFTGASAAIEQTADAPFIETGDGDPFVDNCEIARLNLLVRNTGGTALTNVRVTSITPSSPQTQVLTPLPILLPNLDSGCGGANSTTLTSFRFKAGGQASQSTLTFNVTVTANEISGPVNGTLTVTDTETDLSLGNAVFDFESGTQGWTTFSGTFDRTNLPPPGAEGSAFYLKSSAAKDDACDRARSPKLRLTANSTMSLFNQFVTESDADGAAYDRGNVSIINAQGQTSMVSPSGGRLYNVTNSYTGCNNGPGWATTLASPDNPWAQSTWSSAALNASGYAGQEVQIELAYGTDPLTSLLGFQFDQVRVTNVLFRVPDQQSNVCAVPNQAPDAVDDTATTRKNQPVRINVLANDRDPEGQPLTVTTVTDPPRGTATRNADNTITYNPDRGFSGQDSFQYTVCDPGGLCDTATVRVSVLEGAQNDDDDDDFDDDGNRDDADDDDDSDGLPDGSDDDDDNDGVTDDRDDDDDNDNIRDEFDSESTREEQDAAPSTLLAGAATQSAQTADAKTTLLVALAEGADASLVTVEISNPAGTLVASSLPTPGRALATAPTLTTGTYTVKVRNNSSGAVSYQMTVIKSSIWF